MQACNFTMTDYTALIAATDNCDNNLDIVQVPAPGTVVSGTTAVDINITDDAGNTTTCTFDVIVEDNTDPVITVCAQQIKPCSLTTTVKLLLLITHHL